MLPSFFNGIFSHIVFQLLHFHFTPSHPTWKCDAAQPNRVKSKMWCSITPLLDLVCETKIFLHRTTAFIALLQLVNPSTEPTSTNKHSLILLSVMPCNKPPATLSCWLAGLHLADSTALPVTTIQNRGCSICSHNLLWDVKSWWVYLIWESPPLYHSFSHMKFCLSFMIFQWISWPCFSSMQFFLWFVAWTIVYHTV